MLRNTTTQARARKACMYVNNVTLSPIHTNTLIYKDKTGDKRGDKRVTMGLRNRQNVTLGAAA